jgi:hypothetical protein
MCISGPMNRNAAATSESRIVAEFSAVSEADVLDRHQQVTPGSGHLFERTGASGQAAASPQLLRLL